MKHSVYYGVEVDVGLFILDFDFWFVKEEGWFVKRLVVNFLAGIQRFDSIFFIFSVGIQIVGYLLLKP